MSWHLNMALFLVIAKEKENNYAFQLVQHQFGKT